MSDQLGPTGVMLRMTLRPAGRLLPHLVLLALVAFVLASALLLGEGISREASRTAGRLGADIMILSHGSKVEARAPLLGGIPVTAPLPAGIDTQIAAMAGVNRVARQYLFSSAADPCCEMGNLLLVGFDPDRDLTVLPWLNPADGLPDRAGELLAGVRVMKAPGATMRFFDHTLTLKARLETSGVATFDAALFIPLPALTAMERSAQRSGRPLTVPRDRPSILLLRLEPALDPHQLALTLERRYPGIQALPISAAAYSERLRAEERGRLRGPLAAAAWLLALIAAGALLFSRFRARRPDFGLLQAYRCGTGVLLLLAALEASALALVGMAAGSLAALGALRLSGHYLALATGLPLLSTGLYRAAAAIVWGIPVFAAALGIEAVLIVLFLLREEPAALLRSER